MIDTERLAEALYGVTATRGYIDIGPMEMIFGGTEIFRDLANEIAAEYTRLLATSASEEPG